MVFAPRVKQMYEMLEIDHHEKLLVYYDSLNVKKALKIKEQCRELGFGKGMLVLRSLLPTLLFFVDDTNFQWLLELGHSLPMIFARFQADSRRVVKRLIWSSRYPPLMVNPVSRSVTTWTRYISFFFGLVGKCPDIYMCAQNTGDKEVVAHVKRVFGLVEQ